MDVKILPWDAWNTGYIFLFIHVCIQNGKPANVAGEKTKKWRSVVVLEKLTEEGMLLSTS